MAHDVFISHSHIDKPTADAVCAMLESKKIRCWIAPRDIAPGVDWPTAISTAIASSRVFVLIFSGNSNRSEDVGRELILAANNNLVIIPFRIENTTPEPGKLYYLARTHWLDAMNPPTQEQIEKLVSAVQIFLTKEEKPQEVGFTEKTPREETFENVNKNRVSYPRSKFNPKKTWISSIAIFLLIALAITAIWWFGSQKNPLTTQFTEFVSPIIMNTSTPQPIITLTPKPTQEPKPTPTEIPAWVSDFVKPIRTLVAEHDVNRMDNFGDIFWQRGDWLDTGGNPNLLRFEDERLHFSESPNIPWTFWYTDFVMDFTWRFELVTSDHWTFRIRGGEGAIDFYQDFIKIDTTPRDNNEYHFEPTGDMNHTIIIVKDASVALIINDQPIYYGDFLPTDWKSGECAFGIGGSTVIFDDFQFWNLNNLK